MPFAVAAVAVGAAASIASGVMQGQAADEAADKSEKNAQKQINANVADFKLKMQTMAIRMQQVNDIALNETQARKQDSLQKQSTIKVAAGESGVSGPSVNRLVQQQAHSANVDVTNIEINRKNTQIQAQLEAKGMKADVESGNRAAEASVLPGNNWGATAVGAVGTIASAYSGYSSAKK